MLTRCDLIQPLLDRATSRDEMQITLRRGSRRNR